MTVATAAPERFDIGRVFAGGFEIVGRRPLTLIVLTAIFGYLPGAAALWLTTHVLPPPTPAVGLAALGPALQRLALAELIAVIIGGFSWILQGAAATAALSDLGDRPLGVMAALARAAPRMPIVYGLGFLATLGAVLGACLLIVPGVLLALAWSVGGSVASIENAGFRSFGRSAELTRGSRIWIFMIFVAYAIAGLIVTFAVRAVGGVTLAASTPPLWLVLGLQPLASAAVQLFSVATLVSAYIELRGVKDGLAGASLAALLD
jgi:hypothetical protein